MIWIVNVQQIGESRVSRTKRERKEAKKEEKHDNDRKVPEEKKHRCFEDCEESLIGDFFSAVAFPLIAPSYHNAMLSSVRAGQFSSQSRCQTTNEHMQSAIEAFLRCLMSTI